MNIGTNLKYQTMYKNYWWGYLHTNGSYQVKRYFNKRDIDEALESPFVVSVSGVFLAKNREEAFKILKTKI